MGKWDKAKGRLKDIPESAPPEGEKRKKILKYLNSVGGVRQLTIKIPLSQVDKLSKVTTELVYKYGINKPALAHLVQYSIKYTIDNGGFFKDRSFWK